MRKAFSVIPVNPSSIKSGTDIKLISSPNDFAGPKIILTGYINCQQKLSQLYNNCYAYIHGHQFGGTNPTMINALDLNCRIIALKTKFNLEMLKNKNAIYFEKTLDSVINAIVKVENEHKLFLEKNFKYMLPKRYDWDYITKQYLELFADLTSYQNK